MSRGRALTAVGVCILVALVGVIIALAAPSAPSAEQRARDVAESLRCPTCVAESVADSQAPVAIAMRALIDDRVHRGDSPDQILSWFRRQYGEGILLDPGASGIGILFWVIPVAIVIVAALGAAGRRRWRLATFLGAAAAALILIPLLTPGESPAVVAEEDQVDGIDLLTSAAEAHPGDLDLRRGLADALASAGRSDEAADEYAAAYRLDPGDRRIALDYAGALITSGRADEALPVLESAHARYPDDAAVLLLLGTLLDDRGSPRGDDLLRRYLELEPESALRDAVETRLVAPGPPASSGTESG
ncbi:tetratricopeptide repeat protein [Labedella populi]|uniref:Cytochrome c-type biogenesis protein n=1 Tax=Labedella populi TaxID=2498850 RepID=A0A3S3ZYZ5_9MICO|nr:cytochrome c-type biogenesis protein CcmH [Labedella populi]RWZ67991.1 tetratricopeptide repeat protein [Labedella populi]